MANPGLRFRVAGPADAHPIALLHTDSWQRHYRGAYSDAFLDGEAPEYLARLWTERLADAESQTRTLLAESENDDTLLGFAHTVLDQDSGWGASVDNLHVRSDVKRQGTGGRLLALTAQKVRDRSSVAACLSRAAVW